MKADARTRAAAFAVRFAATTSEKQNDQDFMRGFIGIFTDEEPADIVEWQSDVLNRKGTHGWIDGLIPGSIGFEVKSARKSLDKGLEQIRDYIAYLPARKRPQVIVVSDFRQFLVIDPDNGEHRFPLTELPDHLGLFSTLFTQPGTYLRSAGKVNEEGARLLADVVSHVRASGYPAEFLPDITQRLLVCLYSEDNGVFRDGEFHKYITETKADGSDLGSKLDYLFDLLNKPKAKGTGFAYINGGVFADEIPLVEWDAAGRLLLIEACEYDWTGLDPTIFGNIFESLMDSEERHQDGVHYTHKSDIEDILGPALLNGLREKYLAVRNDKRKLRAFIHDLPDIHTLDPACGSGNFLLVAYDNLRKLEDEAIKQLRSIGGERMPTGIRLGQFHGIEYKPLAASVARTSMWLAKIVADQRHRDLFGELALETFPLRESADIVCGNSATTDWTEAFPGMTVIVGNPPYISADRQTPQMRAERAALRIEGGKMDYAHIWMVRAAQYIAENPSVVAGYVITASAANGTQAKGLWSHDAMSGVYPIFGRQSYVWPGAANVRVVNIGLGSKPEAVELLGEDHVVIPANYLTPYLAPSPSASRGIATATRSAPSWITPIKQGKPYEDFGHYVKLGDDLAAIEQDHPEMLMSMVGATEALYEKKHPVLWWKNRSTATVAHPAIARRREAVRQKRRSDHPKGPEWVSPSVVTGTTMVIPRHFSKHYAVTPVVPVQGEHYMTEGVYYGPLDWFTAGLIMSKKATDAQRGGGGRIGDSGNIRYNTGILYGMPAPTNDTPALRAKIAAKAQECVEARPGPAATCMKVTNMSESLAKLHRELDALVDSWWG